LEALGLALNVAVVVPGFRTALTIAAASDLVAVVPLSYFERLYDPQRLQPLPLPLRVPPFNVSQMWHPRWDRDPGHRWLRQLVRQVCGEAMGAAG
jgi:DNA-binding transcriptional LysR family regulator